MIKTQTDLCTAIKFLIKADPVLSQIIQVTPNLKLCYRKPNFEGLIQIIINQQISNKAAQTIFQRLKTFYANREITPVLIENTSTDLIRSCGMSISKINFAKSLSQHFKTNPNFIEKLKKSDSESVITELEKLKGIGNWSSRIFALFYLQHPNIFVIGDATISKAMNKLYGKNHTLNEKQISTLKKRWSPHNSTACKILWAWVDNGMAGINSDGFSKLKNA